MHPAPLRLKHFLDALCDESRPVIPAHDVAVVVAHPDDETIGCGALLGRMEGVSVTVVTDGAPILGTDARELGFADRASYAAERACELERALGIAGVPSGRIVRLGVPDQQAARQMEHVIPALERSFVQHDVAIVLTHAYEGGHPDHDATAFCVQAALQRGRREIAVVEMPYYRLGSAGEEFQTFPDDRGVFRVLLSSDERARKLRMVESHHTQRRVLAAFSLASEQFRVAPRHDFSRLPNGGRVLYDSRRWGMTSGEWLCCAQTAQCAVAETPCGR